MSIGRIGGFLMAITILQAPGEAVADVLKQTYSAERSLELSGGKSNACAKYGSEERRTYSDITGDCMTGCSEMILCADADGAYRLLRNLVDPSTMPVAFLWHGRPPYDAWHGKTFFETVGVSEIELVKFLKAKGGAAPVFLPLTLHLGRNRAKGDFLLPFCFPTKGACSDGGRRIDGIVVIRRSGKIGTYIVRDLANEPGGGSAEYCRFTSAEPICDISRMNSIRQGPPGQWSMDYYFDKNELVRDYYVTTITTNARMPEAVRLDLNAAGQKRWQDFDRRQKEADRRDCEDYVRRGGIAVC